MKDRPVSREGVANSLKTEQDLVFCGAADNAAKARRDIARLKPDLVLVDVSSPRKGGLELIKQMMRSVAPNTKVLVLSLEEDALYANRVLRMGGDGYVLKQEDSGELVDAIRDVLNGYTYVSEEVLASASKPAPHSQSRQPERPLDRLSAAELKILGLLGQGKTNQEIARVVHCAARQVAVTCAEIRKKLGLKNDNALIRYAVCWLEMGRA